MKTHFKTSLIRFVKFNLILSFLIFNYINSYSQEHFDPKVRAKYIFDVSKYVKWPNISDIDTFTIGVLNDSSLVKELNLLTNDKLTPDEKPIKIILFNDIEQITKTQIIFDSKQNENNIDSIFNKIKGNNTLLITENQEFNKSMLNFIMVNNLCRFELNKRKIDEENLIIPQLMIAQAVKTKEDWEKLYIKTDYMLQKEKEVVRTQKIEIEEQKEQITEQNIKIQEQLKNIKIQQKKIFAQKKELKFLIDDIKIKQDELNKTIKTINEQKLQLFEQKAQVEKQKEILDIQKSEIENQENEINEQKKDLNKLLAELKMQRVILFLFIILFFVISGLGYVSYRAYKIKKEANIILHEKNVEISRQKQEILDSINYASRIQAAVLPPEEFLTKILPENFFILNKPRDVVSGDYYWMALKDDKIVIAVADCTGHGVPGAFMSMLGISFMNEIIKKDDVINADEILNLLRDNVIKSLHQTGESGESKDGMDIALCVLDLDKNILQYSGAYNPLYLIRNKELLQFKADKMPIGIHIHKERPFTNHVIDIQKDDSIYIFSDGYVDQFGGEKNSKFKIKPFKQLLIDIQDKTMNEQKEILNKTIEKWKGSYDQIDDILVMGIKI
ncbi:MAG: DUF4154 domain-containing protein [Bacteroidales bacterium]|nr:DUF4154 domain-containing protein [Bacteroidales bacterium]